MPTGVPTASGSVAAGSPAPDTTIDRKCIIVGCTSTGSGLSVFKRTSAALISERGLGDAVDTGCGVIEQLNDAVGAGQKYPVAICTVPATVPGSYGAIDVSGLTGTATAALDLTVIPLGTHEARVRVSTGGTLGTAGIAVQWSRNAGRSYSNPIALGVATGFTVPGGAGRVEFSPAASDLTALNTLINEEFTDYNAHVILTTGTVHTNADTADQVSAGTYPSATNTATRVARINALVAAAKLHTVKGTGGTPATHINVGGDAAGLTALNLLPVATDDDSALAAAIGFKSWLNAHDAGTTWHTIADATNTVTSPSPAAGTLLTGALVKWRTIAPAPLSADIFEPSDTPPSGALATIARSGAKAAFIAFDFDVDAAMANTISDGLDYCNAAGKDVAALVRVRAPNAETSETDLAWSTDIAADWINFVDYRIVAHADYGLTKHAVTGAQIYRTTFAQFVAENVRRGRGSYACGPKDRKMANTVLVDATGADVGHDEGSRGGGAVLADYEAGNRFSSCFRSAQAPGEEDVYLTVPFTCYGPTDTIKNLAVLTIVNAVKRVALAAAFLSLGDDKIAYEAADTSVAGSVPTIPQTTREMIQGAMLDAIASEFAGEVQNYNDRSIDTGIVQIPAVCTVDAGNLVTIPATLKIKVFGILIAVPLSISVQE